MEKTTFIGIGLVAADKMIAGTTGGVSTGAANGTYMTLKLIIKRLVT